MLNIRILAAVAAVTGLMMMAVPAKAGAGATGCDDLDGIAETPAVDFQSQIQPIFDACASCHGESGSAGLDLRAGVSYDNLIGVTSTTNPSRLRVDPFEPDTSTLFLAVSCDSPGGPGFRMPGTDLSQRALIRDWIAQGALHEPAGAPDPVTVSVNSPWAAAALIALLVLLGGAQLRRSGTG